MMTHQHIQTVTHEVKTADHRQYRHSLLITASQTIHNGLNMHFLLFLKPK